MCRILSSVSGIQIGMPTQPEQTLDGLKAVAEELRARIRRFPDSSSLDQSELSDLEKQIRELQAR
jgi:hypothetical protein